jgi:hypothetical protein
MTFLEFEDEPKRHISPLMPDPVEHAVVEATWGEVFTREDPVLLQALGTMSLHDMAEKTINRGLY